MIAQAIKGWHRQVRSEPSDMRNELGSNFRFIDDIQFEDNDPSACSRSQYVGFDKASTRQKNGITL